MFLSRHSPDSRPLGAIVCLIEAPQRNSIAADPRTAKWRDIRPRNAGTRRFSMIKARLCRRRLSHLTRSPGHAGAGGARSRAISEAASILAIKQRENPFFEYVAHGPTDRMLNQILAKCPAPENDPPHARFQWAWERVDDEQPPPWKQTMYWDCLTVANLYKNGPADARGLIAPDLGGATKQANDAVNGAIASVQSIIESIKSLITDCEKLGGKCAVSLLTTRLKHIEQEAKKSFDQLSRGEIPTPMTPPGLPPLPLPTPSKPAPLPTPALPTPSNPIPRGSVTGIPGSPF